MAPEILELVRQGTEHIPILLDASGAPLRRHIVHIDDVIQALDKMLDNPKALNQTFNIAAPEPFDYRAAAAYLSSRTGLPTIDIPCPAYHSFAIDISKARSVLGYDPENTFEKMADRALSFRSKT